MARPSRMRFAWFFRLQSLLLSVVGTNTVPELGISMVPADPRVLLELTEEGVNLSAVTGAAGQAKNAESTHARRAAAELPAWRDHTLGLDARVDSLLQQMSLQEKLSQMNTISLPIQRLGIPAFNWWAECIHGAMEQQPGRHGGTIFPQPIALAATFSSWVIKLVATAVSDELRAASNYELKQNGQHKGINCFGPHINIFRDPRWGRGSETYGEDPFLTSVMAMAFVEGLQGNHSKYIKVGATCKHWAAYSMEQAEGETRFNFNARISAKDWADTYTPAFHACAAQSGASSVMCGYNAVNGVPVCAAHGLLDGQLRNGWGFDGFVVSDCAAIQAITLWHKHTPGYAEGAAAALSAGTDLACDEDYKWLEKAIQKNFTNEAVVDTALRRVLKARFKLGMFDPVDQDPWRSLEAQDVIGSKKNKELAKRAARESIVLLKNIESDGAPALPLAKDMKGKIMVIGFAANTSEYLLANYFGYPAGEVTTPLQAIQEKLGDKDGRRVEYYEGPAPVSWRSDSVYWSELKCRDAAVCIFFVGSIAGNTYRSSYPTEKVKDGSPLFSVSNENEEHDRTHLKLPGVQEDAIKAVAKWTNAKIIVALIHGGPLDVSWFEASPRVAAILTAWYPGQGAAAIADVLFGDYNPGGKLPVTFYYNNYTEQVSALSMSMRDWPGRTYRFLQVPVLYPFGHGLSYTTFKYNSIEVVPSVTCDSNGKPLLSWQVNVHIENTGSMAGDEVVLFFARHSRAAQVFNQRKQWVLPAKSLRSFRRIHLKSGSKHVATTTLTWSDFRQPLDGSGELHLKYGLWIVDSGNLSASILVPPYIALDCRDPESLKPESWEKYGGDGNNRLAAGPNEFNPTHVTHPAAQPMQQEMQQSGVQQQQKQQRTQQHVMMNKDRMPPRPKPNQQTTKPKSKKPFAMKFGPKQAASKEEDAGAEELQADWSSILKG